MRREDEGGVAVQRWPKHGASQREPGTADPRRGPRGGNAVLRGHRRPA